MSDLDFSLPFAEVSGAPKNDTSMVVFLVVIAIIVIVVICVVMKKKPASAASAASAAPAKMLPQAAPQAPLPPRISEIPTSIEAHKLPMNAPEPSPFAGFSGREAMYAEYVPGPQYELAYRQSNSPVKLSMIECKTADMFRDIVLTNKKDVVCAFTSAGCGHCTAMKPEFEKAASQAHIPFLIIERSAAGDDLLQGYGIRGFPTILRFRDGQPIGEFKDERTAEKLLQFAV